MAGEDARLTAAAGIPVATVRTVAGYRLSQASASLALDSAPHLVIMNSDLTQALVLFLFTVGVALAQPAGSWNGTLHDPAGKPLAGVLLELTGPAARSARTTPDGAFAFPDLPPGRYTVTIGNATAAIAIEPASFRKDSLRFTGEGAITLIPAAELTSEAAGGEQLSSRQVSALPLNKRDFSQLLLLAAGTRTDTNGAANFTQQFTVNGQRGTATVFSMDGADVTDPEMGGATFSNFNVDAIQEINASAGVMPASIGHGAAGFTAIVTKSGVNDLHGSIFEFVRNAAFDARNFFDRRSVAQPGRIPPFNRNEFGLSNGGPLAPRPHLLLRPIPGLPPGARHHPGALRAHRRRTRRSQHDGLSGRRALRARQSEDPAGPRPLSPAQRSRKAPMVRAPTPSPPRSARSPTSSPSGSTTELSDKARLFGRFSLNNVDGPLTNPSQTAHRPVFRHPLLRSPAQRRRSSYDRAPSAPTFTMRDLPRLRPLHSELSRPSTRLNPRSIFGDGLYEGFNSAGRFHHRRVRQPLSRSARISRGRAASTPGNAGAEIRVNRDSTIYGTTPNGAYTFGGGAAYSPVDIRSAQRAARHRTAATCCPTALTGFLTATPFSYTVTAAPPLFAQGARMGDRAVRREAYNFYLQDTWKMSPRLSLNYGLRYELNSRIKEGRLRTSGLVFENGAARFLVNRAAGLSPRHARLGTAPRRRLAPQRPHALPRGRIHHHAAHQSVAGQLRHRRTAIRRGAAAHRRAGQPDSLFECFAAARAAQRLHTRRQPDLSHREFGRRRAEYRTGRAAFRARPRRAGRRSSSAPGHRWLDGRQFPQRLHRRLDRRRRTQLRRHHRQRGLRRYCRREASPRRLP